jgi:hypothetical protein
MALLTGGALAAGIALGSGATSGADQSGLPDRAALVPFTGVGIEVPVRTTELVDVSKSTRLTAFDDQTWVFRAPGRGEFAGDVCIFVAAPSGPSDVVPMACDSPEAARSRGLDLGHSTADGGIEGVVAREDASGQMSAEPYTVGPAGGDVTVQLDAGPPVTLSFPNLKALNETADRDAREHMESLRQTP